VYVDSLFVLEWSWYQRGSARRNFSARARSVQITIRASPLLDLACEFLARDAAAGFNVRHAPADLVDHVKSVDDLRSGYWDPREFVVCSTGSRNSSGTTQQAQASTTSTWLA
jgi:hypothetical protein